MEVLAKNHTGAVRVKCSPAGPPLVTDSLSREGRLDRASVRPTAAGKEMPRRRTTAGERRWRRRQPRADDPFSATGSLRMDRIPSRILGLELTSTPPPRARTERPSSDAPKACAG